MRRAGWCSISTPRRTSNSPPSSRRPREMRDRLTRRRPGELLQDDRRQGPACGARCCTARRTRSTGRTAKAFAQDVCQQMAERRVPSAICSTCRRSCARERSSSTICATTGCRPRSRVLSPARARRRHGARCRVTWTQVRNDLDPKKFTVRTVPALAGEDQGVGRLRRCRRADQGGDEEARAGWAEARSPPSRTAFGSSRRACRFARLWPPERVASARAVTVRPSSRISRMTIDEPECRRRGNSRCRRTVRRRCR